MSTEFLVALAFILLAALLAVIVNRGAMLLVILLPASEALGFLDPMTVAIKGAFDIHALEMMIIVLMIAWGLGRLSDLREATFLAPFALLMTFWLYGWIMPVARGESTALQGLEASKEFMVLLAYPATLLFLRTEREIKLAWLLLISLGAYYCALEILVQFAGLALLSKLTYFYRPDDFGLWKVYVQFWSVILYFFLYFFFMHLAHGKLRLWALMLGTAGVFLTFYRSYVLALLVATPIALMLAKMPLTRMVKAGTSAMAGLCAVIAATAVFAVGHGTDVGEVGRALVYSGVEEIYSGSGGSLAGRREHASDLHRLADQRPWLGYGFINRESQLANSLDLPGFSASVLGFVDKGSADVVVKFGYVGGAIVYAAFAWIALRAIRIARRTRDQDLSSKALTIAAVIFISFMVQPVHAPLTYSFALLPLGIAMGIVDRHQLLVRRADAPHA